MALKSKWDFWAFATEGQRKILRRMPFLLTLLMRHWNVFTVTPDLWM